MKKLLIIPVLFIAGCIYSYGQEGKKRIDAEPIRFLRYSDSAFKPLFKFDGKGNILFVRDSAETIKSLYWKLMDAERRADKYLQLLDK